MASSPTTRLRLEKQADGENDSTWGAKANTVFDLLDEAVMGYLSKDVAGASDVTLTAANYASDESRQFYIKLTGALTGSINVIVPTPEGRWVFENATSESFTLTVKTSAGTGIAITQGEIAFLYCDGTNVEKIFATDDWGTGSGDLLAANNLSDVASASTSRTNLGLGSWAEKSSLVLSKTTAYTIVAGDDGKLIKCDGTSGIFTVTLLAAATAGDGYVLAVKKTDASGNAITIDGDGSETIDGSTTVTLSNQNDWFILRCDGSNWFIVSKTSGTPPDNSVGLAQLAPGTAGNLITYDASGDPAAVATGTSGQVLTSAGAGAEPTFSDASVTPSDASVTQAKLSTATASLSGNISATNAVDLTFQPYCFFPMIHTTDEDVHLSGHDTDGADPDAPRMRLHNTNVTTARTYDVDYRYIQA